MCGIAGIVSRGGSLAGKRFIPGAVKKLFLLSESRGKDASGMAVITRDRTIVAKNAVRAAVFVKSREFDDCLNEGLAGYDAQNPGGALTVLLHARLATNGSRYDRENNAPCVRGRVTGIHNGIVVNGGELEQTPRGGENDSNVMFTLLDALLAGSPRPEDAFRGMFARIEGAASVAAYINGEERLLLGTNTGSLYFSRAASDAFLFASEGAMLKKFSPDTGITQVRPGSALSLYCPDLSWRAFELT